MKARCPGTKVKMRWIPLFTGVRKHTVVVCFQSSPLLLHPLTFSVSVCCVFQADALHSEASEETMSRPLRWLKCLISSEFSATHKPKYQHHHTDTHTETQTEDLHIHYLHPHTTAHLYQPGVISPLGQYSSISDYLTACFLKGGLLLLVYISF